MFLDIKGFNEYVNFLPEDRVQTCRTEIVHWADLTRQSAPFSIVDVENGMVNGIFHLADPASGIYVHDQQNAFYSKPASGRISSLGAFEINNDNIVDHDAVALVIGGHRNHWHFLINFLPRLMMVEAFFPSILDSVDTIVLNDDPNSFQLEVIKRIFKKDKITLLSRQDQAWHRFRRVYYPSMVKNIEMNPFALQRARCRLLEAFDLLDAVGAENGIFVDRSYPTPRRRLANSSVINKILNQRRINPMLCEKFTPREQVAAFFTAPVVAGLHGAGMANIIFCRPHTPVVIVDYKWPSEMYALAAVMGLRPNILLADQDIDHEYEALNPKFQSRLRDLKPAPKQMDAALCSAWLLAQE